MEIKKLILVDGSSYLYRAYHAMPGLGNSKGQPTGAIYGVVNMLKRLESDYPGQDIVVVFDAPGPTFRDDLYKEYKANREAMPDDLREQIPPLHEVIKAQGFPLLSIAGVEADDVIGTLAAQAAANKRPVIISTGDKDMAQLVNEHITLVDTMKNTTMDRKGVKEKFGVFPEQIIDYLALIGDTSDNVPGVPKVGPKTALKWLEEFHNLDALIKNADAIKGKVGENFRGSLEQLPLSRQLVTIKTDVKLDENISLKRQDADRDKLKQLYSELEFKTWLAQILGHEGTQGDLFDAGGQSAESTRTDAGGDYETILDEKSFTAWLKKLEQAELTAIDTETTSLDSMQAKLVGLSFSVEAGKAAYLPLGHTDLEAPPQLAMDKVLKALKPLLENPRHKKVGQNIKYDMNVLAHHGIEMQGVAYDTMLESYVLDSTATRHNMDALALKYLAYKTITYEEVAGKGAKQISFADVPIARAAAYAAEDADITLRLHQVLWPRLCESAELKQLFETIEVPVLSVLSRMERNGVLLDVEQLQRQSRQLGKRLSELEEEAFDIAGGPFNLASPMQIQEILFDKMKLPVKAKTPKGQPSTAESVLQELALDYPLPRIILEHRSLAKLKSTYTDALPQQINPASGRVHTSYNQAVAVTGRLSSTEPNLQNIPVRTAEGRRIRQAFIAPPGKKIVAADYSQIELRIMAHLSEDKGLLNAFGQGQDIHKATAAEVFGVDSEAVTKEMRRRAKAINFGLIYGMSAFGLARQLDIERGEAQRYIDLYFERYPGVKNYMDTTREIAKQQGYVETVFGRRLYLPEINSRNGQRRQYAERSAINAPMQGSAADIIKRAMLRVDEWIRKEHDQSGDVRMIMQVHDELVFEIDEKKLEKNVKNIRSIMESAAELRVPLIVDSGIGNNWDEAH